MSLPGPSGRWKHCVIDLFVHYQTCEYDILKMNELIFFYSNWHKWSTGQGQEKIVIKLWGQLRGQGHTRLKTDLEAWWRHLS